MSYTPLYIQSENSLLSSMIRIPELIKCAKEKGFTSLAIADNSMFGAIEFYNECLKNSIKPIIGLEITYQNTEIILYAKNYEGYQNLCKLVTICSKEEILECHLKEYNENLICIIPYKSKYLEIMLKNIYEYVYMGYTNLEEYQTLKKEEAIYINKILSLTKDDTKYLPYLEAIKKNCLVSNITTDYSDKYMYDMENYLKNDYDISINQHFTSLINLEIKKRDGLLPIYDTKGIPTYDYLKKLCVEGLKKRFGLSVPKIYIDRLKYELSVIDKMGFSNYFLVVYDYVNYAKENDILVGPGRGSAAGSLVSYVLYITDIDPIRYNLLFERFLNPNRITMPDIDIDFLDSSRDKVIKYCVNKYGLKKASGIITFGTLASRQAIRDTFKTLGINSDLISNMIDSKYTLKENFNKNLKLQNYLNEHKELKTAYFIATKIEGLKRHTSIHAAGMVISSVDLDSVVPLYYHDDMYLCAYSMNYLEDLGLLKMDFLGLKNLNIIDRVLKNLSKDNILLSFDKIPLNDNETFKIFEEVNTIGIFQFESEGMMKFLKKFKPKTFEDIYAALALYRPGPMGNIDIYIRRKEGKEKVNYYDSRLEPILKPTYGILIYQEQIMQVANVMASYTLGEADILRRAMSKKKEDVLLKEREKFISRSIQNGYDEKTSTEVYELILKFASYGFNKAHSVAYAMISYRMAYLKAHYPLYFLKSLLDMSIGSSASSKKYIYEAKKNHLEIMLPDINLSTNEYEIVSDKILYPLYNIKNIGITTCNGILEERSHGEYKDIFDFAMRTYKVVNKQTLSSLILAGCFDKMGYSRHMLIENIDLILNYAEVANYLEPEYALKPALKQKDEYTKKELMSFEYELFGFYLSSHPILEYRLKYQENLRIKQVKDYFDKVVSIIVEVKNIKEINTKNGDVMCFLTCEDEIDTLDVVLFPRYYQKYKVKYGDIILLTGRVEKRYDQLQISASKIEILKD
jgi:DNA polymerase-3 subunit alpha